MKLHPCVSRTVRLATAMLISAVALFGPALAHAEGKSLSDALAENKQLGTLTRALQAAGLGETLASAPAVTLLAPTDAAFAALPGGTLENLLKPENKDLLVSLLKRHVIPAALDLEALKRKRDAPTLAGGTVKLALVNGVLRVNDARAGARATRTSNGYVLVIDHVLMQ